MSDSPDRPRMYSVRLRLTLAGWLYLLVAILVGVAAVKSEAPLAYIVFGGMMGSLMVSGSVAHRGVGGVRLRRDLPDRVWQNTTIHLGYYLKNVRRRSACLGVRVEEIAPEGVESLAGFCLQIAPRTSFRAGARLVAHRRGRVEFRRVRVLTTFPFGLVRAYRTFELPGSFVVWPARGTLMRQLLMRGAVETSTFAPSMVSGGQDEFFGLREYRPGDSPRWIHWRKSASHREPVLREMARPLPEMLWVILDTFLEDLSDLAAHRRERMLRFTATLVDYAFSRGYRVGLAMSRTDGPRVWTPAPGRGQRRKLLDALAEADANTVHRLAATVAALPIPALRTAQGVVVSADEARLRRAPLDDIRRAARRLTMISEAQLDGVFEDDPATIVREDACR